METRIDLRPAQVAIVVGIDHKIQHFIPSIAASHPRNVLRFRFQEFLEQITGGYRVDVICEEAKHGVVSIAQTVADGACIPYREIEMPQELREIHGIPKLYTLDVPGSEIPAEQMGARSGLRESYMVDALLRSIKGTRIVMAICGASHMAALIHALRPKFKSVERYDVTAMPWFDRSLL